MEIVVDTNAVSDYYVGNIEVIESLRHAERVIVPSIVVGEYLAGLEGGSRRLESRELFRRWLAVCTIASITFATAEIYAKARYDLKRRGTPIPTNDIWIAAVAIERNATLLSRDRHFEHIDGLRWLGWT